MSPHDIFLLSTALVSVVLLVLLIAYWKLNPFLALLISSISLALAARMPLATVMSSFENGMGQTLGHIAIVVGLGTMLGKLMAESGGAARIAQTLIEVFGEKRAHWAMVSIGLLVGLPVFFEVGFVLLIPIVFMVAQRTRTSVVFVGLPMLAGLSVMHGLVPPHPAAVLAVSVFHADMGRTIFLSLLIGIPAAIVAGPLYAKFIAPRIALDPHNPMADQFTDHETDRELPGFAITMATILLPVVLMFLGSGADLLTAPTSAANSVLRLIGNADIALLIGVIFSFYTLGKMCGFNRETILRFTNECLAPTATITLLVGAGGGFGRILQDSGVSQAIIAAALRAHVSVILLAWLMAALIRVATGSATVAMTTAAGIVAPLAIHATGITPELLAVATGAGSLIFSHVNDGGFWLVKEYFHMSVPQTLKTWSVCETIISVMGLVLTLLLAAFH